MYLFIDDQNSALDHRNTEGSELSTYISSLKFVWSTNDEYTVDYITT